MAHDLSGVRSAVRRERVGDFALRDLQEKKENRAHRSENDNSQQRRIEAQHRNKPGGLVCVIRNFGTAEDHCRNMNV